MRSLPKCIVSDNDGHKYLILWQDKDRFSRLMDKNYDDWNITDEKWYNHAIGTCRIDHISSIKILEYEEER